MPTPPLAVAVVWHMHQPWYRDDVAGQFILPWVRRRASKDYLHMLRILEHHPEVRVTMNMVPSLLVQLEMYATGDAADVDRDLCLRSADDLTPAERDFLVAGAKHNDYGRRVSLLAAYTTLLNRLPEGDASAVSERDMRDLQVWSLLSWIDPDDIRKDPDLNDLAQRGHDFDESDKSLVDARQIDLLRAVIPAYRDAVMSGRVEPMTTPYHHPILPLLIDGGSARVANPDIPLPDPVLRDEPDAEEHVRRGLAEFARLAGRAAAGMWPAECAVSPEAAALMHHCGVRFAVSDERVLARTLGRDDVRGGGELYTAHAEASGLTLVFRDAQLSNLIGFSYQSVPAGVAAADLLGRLEAIADGQPQDGRQRLVTIALDGENFKDFYEENASPFLDAFYAGLAASPLLASMHIGSFLDENAQQPAPLGRLWTGSWIDADLRTWIGEDAHNRAWALLARAIDAVNHAGGADLHPLAHHELLIAQASDWFWWFGEHHDSRSDAAWDELFRAHLRNAYGLAGLAAPTQLDEPIITGRDIGGDCAPLRSIDPPGAGPPEWRSAGIAEVGAVLGAMRPPASSVSRIYYGAGGGRLHLRFGDGVPRFDRAIVDAGPLGRLTVEHAVRNLSVALSSVAVDFAVTLEEAGRGSERVPASGNLHVETPHPGSQRPVRVLIAAAECAPVAAAGQLAARVAATAAAAAALGHEVVVAIPRHGGADPGERPGIRIARLACTAWGRTLAARVIQGTLPGTRIPVLSIDAPAYFDRDSVYGALDDGERYLAFCALLHALLGATAFDPDIVHGFEWQIAGLIARLAASASPAATVLSVGDGSTGYRVDASALTGIGVARAGVGEIDLLDLGRHSATVVKERSGTGAVAALYETALRRARHRR
jgi:alpha-amylase/alpha-mannosidase (GH57 family)